ncbi:NAD(P)H-binding protein [Paracoccus sp. R86501]|uniref:NAD(P)H-binding protein n=1 Tax=Paracoccus sp. R86501 TaxID=3101711 RepID=UPI00366B1B2D
MAHIFIVGGAGQIARHMTPQLIANGNRVSSLYRHDEQHDQLADLGATPVKGDLTQISVQDMAAMLDDVETVVFAAGAGGAGQELTKAVDGEGFEKTVAAAKEAGVKRIYLTSVFPEAGRTADLGEGFENYMRIKKTADVHLVRSGLEFVIIRPGTLGDDAPTGKVSAGLAVPYGTIQRADVANFMAETIATPQIVNTIIELAPGDDAIPVAVSALA